MGIHRNYKSRHWRLSGISLMAGTTRLHVSCRQSHVRVTVVLCCAVWSGESAFTRNTARQYGQLSQSRDVACAMGERKRREERRNPSSPPQTSNQSPVTGTAINHLNRTVPHSTPLPVYNAHSSPRWHSHYRPSFRLSPDSIVFGC